MCGIAGCYNTEHASTITQLGLYMQQHRGQEWVGMVSSDGLNVYPERAPFRGQGLVMDVLTENIVKGMIGHMAMGHVRYSTQGDSSFNNCQPHAAMTTEGPVYFCSNGDIVNCTKLRIWLQEKDVVFYGQNDGEVIVKLIAYFFKLCNNWVSAIQQAKRMLNGSLSSVLMTRDKMFLFRDYMENRPYSLTFAPDGAVFFASESVALDIMTADYPGFEKQDYRLEELPGHQILELSDGKVIRHDDKSPKNLRRAHCIFEEIYFSRPDSVVFGQPVKEFRHRLARMLVDEAQPDGDVVTPVPDSSVEAAQAISIYTGIEPENILFRHHYIGRTFIAPIQRMRDFGVKLKFNPDRRSIKGKRIVLVDDSIVRGSTMYKIIRMLKRYQPKQITLLITCPLIPFACYYGIDMKDKLIADMTNGDIDQIKVKIGLAEHDRLHFMSLEGLKKCVDEMTISSSCLTPAHKRRASQDWCFACLDGNYPTDISCYEPPV